MRKEVSHNERKEKRYYMENHPGIAVENGSLDEVIVMMIQGETV